MIFLLAVLTFFNFHLSSSIKVKDAWLRPAAKGMNSALYFSIENNTDKADTLYRVTSNAAQLVQIHESFMKNGLMGMKRIEFVVIPAHSKVTFKPGGYHVMFIKLIKDLKVKTFEKAKLYFKSGKTINISAVVKVQS